VGKSAATGANIEFSCWEYKTFAVVQRNDTGSMGAKEIEIRHFDGSKKIKPLCAETSPGAGTVIDKFYGYYVGSRDGFIFIDEPDSFGNQQAFQVFSRNGKELLSERRDSSSSLIIKSAQTTSMTFYKGLEVKCPLAKEGSECWEKVVLLNKIPASLKLEMPDCKTSFKKEKSPLDNNALVSTKVEIYDLNHPAIKYLGGPVTCSPSP
jgi:hypothetical protein